MGFNMLDKSVSEEGVCFGVESTADDYSVGIVTFDGKVLSNVINPFIPETGGIHPREAARHHAEVAGRVISTAFEEARVKPDEISIVAFSQGPGLGPCLRTGATSARALSSYLNIPLVGVNHCVAHIEIGKLTTGAVDPVTLYVSGGNTIVAAFDAGRYRVFGETLDIAAGNCLDVFAREAGFRQSKGMPLGAIVEEQARKGAKLLNLPYSVKGMDLSFSGLLTAITRLLKEGEYLIEDLCFSLEEMVFSMLGEVTERALAHTEKQEILLTGGVAANKRLQGILSSVASDHSSRFCVVPKQYALDNGAMIAWTGILAFRYGLVTPVEKSLVRLRWRLEDVDAPWVRE